VVGEQGGELGDEVAGAAFDLEHLEVAGGEAGEDAEAVVGAVGVNQARSWSSLGRSAW
jgi:hypothetical protein